jgi:hypothetical protein
MYRTLYVELYSSPLRAALPLRGPTGATSVGSTFPQGVNEKVGCKKERVDQLTQEDQYALKALSVATVLLSDQNN